MFWRKGSLEDLLCGSHEVAMRTRLWRQPGGTSEQASHLEASEPGNQMPLRPANCDSTLVSSRCCSSCVKTLLNGPDVSLGCSSHCAAMLLVACADSECGCLWPRRSDALPPSCIRLIFIIELASFARHATDSHLSFCSPSFKSLMSRSPCLLELLPSRVTCRRGMIGILRP